VRVKREISLDSNTVTKLHRGTVVNVLEVVTMPENLSVRARIECPAGVFNTTCWISLLDTDNGEVDEAANSEKIGLYKTVVEWTVIHSGPLFDSNNVTKLPQGTVVNVLEVVTAKEIGLIRARIQNPRGVHNTPTWISLRDTVPADEEQAEISDKPTEGDKPVITPLAENPEQQQTPLEAEEQEKERQKQEDERRRAELKKNAVPVSSSSLNGAIVWEIVLAKRDDNAKYGMTHANAKVEFSKEYAKACRGDGQSGERVATGNLQSVLTAEDCPDALVITRVSDQGLLEEWNFIHPEAEVRPGDRIIAVNDCQAVLEMQKELRTPSVTCKIFRFPDIFHTTLVKRESQSKLGFKFVKPDQRSPQVRLRISTLAQEGLLDEVNRQHMKNNCHHMVVLPGMYIEAANQVEGDCVKIAEELRTCESAELRIRRTNALGNLRMGAMGGMAGAMRHALDNSMKP